MNTLDKIKAEIQKVLDVEGYSENARVQALALFWVLELIDKYAEQEPCDDDYQTDMDEAWKQAKREPCDDVVSRQAVLDGIDTYISKAQSTGTQDAFYSFAELVVKALPSVRPQEPKCRDCVSRDYLLSIANKDGAYGYVSAHEIINAPPVRPQEQTGHWVDIDDEPHEVWECDHCGFVIDGSGCVDPYDYRDTYKFCPNCGAKMVEPQERSDKE